MKGLKSDRRFLFGEDLNCRSAFHRTFVFTDAAAIAEFFNDVGFFEGDSFARVVRLRDDF